MVFTWIDFLLLFVIALSTLIGLMRGLFRELLAIVIWFLAFFIAGFLVEDPTFLHFDVLSPTLRAILVFIVVFLIILIIGFYLGRLLNVFVKKSVFGLLNNGLGALLGFLRGCLVVLIVIFVVDVTSWGENALWQHSPTVQIGQTLLQSAHVRLQAKQRNDNTPSSHEVMQQVKHQIVGA